MTQLQETLIAMWKTMQGMVTPKAVFSEMAEFNNKEILQDLARVYNRSNENILFLQLLAFEEMKMSDFWKMVAPEKEFPEDFAKFRDSYSQTMRLCILWRNFLTTGIMFLAKRANIKPLYYASFSCFYDKETAPEKIALLLKFMNENAYSYQVYLAFCLLIFHNDLIAENDVPLLVSAYEKHKKGLEGRGKSWLKKVYF